VTTGGISAPAALTVDGFGDIWVANSNGSVSEIRGGGTISPDGGFVGGGLSAPNGIVVDTSGNVWVSNSGNNSVTEIIGGAPPTQPLATATQTATIGQTP
jgi:trimeric autotransporter adhesin